MRGERKRSLGSRPAASATTRGLLSYMEGGRGGWGGGRKVTVSGEEGGEEGGRKGRREGHTLKLSSRNQVRSSRTRWDMTASASSSSLVEGEPPAPPSSSSSDALAQERMEEEEDLNDRE